MAEERRKAVRSRAATGSRGRLRSTVEVEIVDLSADGLRFELAAAINRLRTAQLCQQQQQQQQH